jgi:hypothetical protein
MHKELLVQEGVRDVQKNQPKAFAKWLEEHVS